MNVRNALITIFMLALICPLIAGCGGGGGGASSAIDPGVKVTDIPPYFEIEGQIWPNIANSGDTGAPRAADIGASGEYSLYILDGPNGAAETGEILVTGSTFRVLFEIGARGSTPFIVLRDKKTGRDILRNFIGRLPSRSEIPEGTRMIKIKGIMLDPVTTARALLLAEKKTVPDVSIVSVSASEVKAGEGVVTRDIAGKKTQFEAAVDTNFLGGAESVKKMSEAVKTVVIVAVSGGVSASVKDGIKTSTAAELLGSFQAITTAAGGEVKQVISDNSLADSVSFFGTVVGGAGSTAPASVIVLITDKKTDNKPPAVTSFSLSADETSNSYSLRFAVSEKLYRAPEVKLHGRAAAVTEINSDNYAASLAVASGDSNPVAIEISEIYDLAGNRGSRFSASVNAKLPAAAMVLAEVPVISPPAGKYTATVEVSISCATPGAAIRFTSDGSAPSRTAGTIYSGPFKVYKNSVIKAVAYADKMKDSALAAAEYKIERILLKADKPVITPAGGAYGTPLAVTIAAPTGGTVVRYTTDGSDPSPSNGTLYAGPIAVGSRVTIKAVAYGEDNSPSDIAAAEFIVTEKPVTSRPVISGADTGRGTVLVTISCPDASAAVRYTLDGNEPSPANGALYSAPFEMSGPFTVKASASAPGKSVSPVVSASFSSRPEPAVPPVFSLPSGKYKMPVAVSISSASPGVSIRYTTDGTAPSETAGELYSSTLSLNSDATVKAVAYGGKYSMSPVSEAHYQEDTSPVIIVADSERPKFTIAYYRDAALSLPAGPNPRLGPGNWYLALRANERLKEPPVVTIRAEGTANNVTAATASQGPGDAYVIDRVIVSDPAAFGDTPEAILISASDEAGNAAVDASAENASEAAYIDTVRPAAPEYSSTVIEANIDGAGNTEDHINGVIAADMTKFRAGLANQAPGNSAGKIYIRLSDSGGAHFATSSGSNIAAGAPASGIGGFTSGAIADFAAGDLKIESWIVDAAGNGSDTASVTIAGCLDRAVSAPALVSISSSGAVVSRAKAGDTVLLRFIPSETIISAPEMSISGEDRPVTLNGVAYEASRVTTAGDDEGAVAFEISYSDLAGNSSSVSGSTDASSVTLDVTPPQVSASAITFPNGGESLRGGQAATISWNVSLINDNIGLSTAPVSLHYSVDGGSSWTAVSSSEANDGSCSWNVPSTDSSTALVRLGVDDLSANRTTIVSESAFTIDSTRPRPVSGSVAAANAYAEVNFSEPVYGPASSAPSAVSFSVIYEQNSGVTGSVSISSVKAADGSDPSGGESVLRLYLTLSSPPSGVEKIKIGPSGATALYDAVGNAMDAAEFTPSLALKDTRPPEVSSIYIASDLSYIDISFTEGVYGPSTAAVTLSDIEFVFSRNSGNATAASMTWLKKTDGSSLSGGESIIRAGLSVTGGPSGVETIAIKPVTAASLYDIKGNAVPSSYASNIAFLSDNDAPPAPDSITITPIDGTVVTNTLNSTNTNMVVTASITAGTATGGKGKLYIDGRQIATDETILAGDTLMSFDLGTTTNGSLAAIIPSGGVISVEVVDASGNGAPSVAGNPTLSVNYDRPAAAVTYSPSGVVKAGTVLTISAAFNEAVSSASLPKISLSGGNVIAATDMTKVDDSHFTYTHTVGAGDGTASVSFSGTSDAYGNPVETVPLSGTGFAVDNTPPSAALTYSPDTPVKSSAIVTISAVTSEPLGAAALKLSISGANSLAVTSMTKIDDTHYSYSYTAGAGNGTASVSLSNATDVVGNAIVSAPSSGAAFIVDNTAPNAYLTYSPVNKLKAGSAVTITAVFNEPVSDLFTPTITATGTEAFAAASMTRVDATHYTYLHTIVSAGNGTSSVTLAGAKDLAGNAVTATPTSGNQFFIDNVIPTASIYYSLAGPYITGKNVTITAVFSETMAASPVPVISISGANTLASTAMTMVDTTHYTLAYTVGSGDGFANITLGAGTDIAGNALQAAPLAGGSFGVDNSSLVVSFATVASDNSYIDVGFSEGIFGAPDGETPAAESSFELIFNDNGGAATDAEIASITKIGGATVSGGETTLRFNLNVTGTATGIETVEIKPSATASLYDEAGNALSTVQTTGVKNLNNAMLPTISGVTYSVNPTRFKQGTLITITANFSASVAAAPVPKINISGANTVTNSAMTMVSATSYKYGYAVGAGGGEASISIAADPSVPPAPFNPTPVSGGTFTVDNTPPSFTVSGYQVNAAGDVIEVVFDEDMTSPTSLQTKSNWTFYYADNNAGLNVAPITITNATLLYSAVSRTLTVTLNEATDNAYIPLGKYLRAVSHATNIKDVAGNSSGALSVYSQNATPTEVLPPTFTISGTSVNNAGDTIVLTFSDSMYTGGSAMISKANWTIHCADDQVGTNLKPVIIANATLSYSQATRKLTITLHEGTDKSFIPDGKYVRAIPHATNIKDLAGNAIGSFSAYSVAPVAKETVSPSVSSVTATSSNNANDIIYINFNDYMDTTPAVLTNRANWKIEYADDAAGTNAQIIPINTATLALNFTSTRKRIDLTLNELADGAYIRPGKYIIVTPLSSAPTDLVGNPLLLTPKATAAVVTTETTAPTISSITATSVTAGGDQININFSELMNTIECAIIDKANWQLQYADDSIGTNIQSIDTANAIVSYVPASKKVMFTLDEVTDNMFIPASKFIKATVLVPSNLKDLVGNQCTTASKVSATAITKEATRPLIFSIVLGNGNGQINNGDSIVITFTEHINPATINAGLTKGGSVVVNTAVPGQVTWVTTNKTISINGICSFPITKAANFANARVNTSQTTLALDATGKVLTITLDTGVTTEAVLANTATQTITAVTTVVKDLVGNFLNTTTTYKVAIGQKF